MISDRKDIDKEGRRVTENFFMGNCGIAQLKQQKMFEKQRKLAARSDY